MKRTFKVTELSHSELVHWLCTATYGNRDLIGISVEEEPENFDESNTDRIEDNWAEVLLQGGTLRIHDFGGAESCSGKPTKADYLTTKGKADMAATEWNGWCGSFWTPDYIVDLKRLLKGISCEKAASYIQTLFVDEDGDLWDAYNLLQIALWGEEIYG